VRAYDRDGSPADFSAERYYIYSTWQGVAEDFAPFDVNVTTREPSSDALLKSSPSDPTYGLTAVITPDNVICPGTPRTR
jgi:hypothetical protein